MKTFRKIPAGGITAEDVLALWREGRLYQETSGEEISAEEVPVSVSFLSPHAPKDRAMIITIPIAAAFFIVITFPFLPVSTAFRSGPFCRGPLFSLKTYSYYNNRKILIFLSYK